MRCLRVCSLHVLTNYLTCRVKAITPRTKTIQANIASGKYATGLLITKSITITSVSDFNRFFPSVHMDFVLYVLDLIFFVFFFVVSGVCVFGCNMRCSMSVGL